jgi:hypothetical protein
MRLEAVKNSGRKISWRRVLALIWAIAFLPITVLLMFGEGLEEGSHPLQTSINLLCLIVFLIGTISGLRWPFSSWLILLPVPVALTIIYYFFLIYR